MKATQPPETLCLAKTSLVFFFLRTPACRLIPIDFFRAGVMCHSPTTADKLPTFLPWRLSGFPPLSLLWRPASFWSRLATVQPVPCFFARVVHAAPATHAPPQTGSASRFSRETRLGQERTLGLRDDEKTAHTQKEEVDSHTREHKRGTHAHTVQKSKRSAPTIRKYEPVLLPTNQSNNKNSDERKGSCLRSAFPKQNKNNINNNHNADHIDG